jgi:hypothetical protein
MEVVREIVRRPFFAKILDQSFVAESTDPSFSSQSDVDLLENWWNRSGYNSTGADALARQRAILDRSLTGPWSLSTD